MLVHAARLQLRCQTVVAASRPLFTSAARRSVKIPSLGDITARDSASFKGRLAAFREERKRPVSPPPPSPTAAPSAPTSQPGTEPPKSGIVKSILYGSEKGQREEAEMEQSYSKVLARGKYVHAIEFHHVKPDKHEEYVRLVGDAFPKIAEDPNNKCHLVGSWKTEIGMPDIFVHIWEYQGYTGYHETLTRVGQTPHHKTLAKELPQYLVSRRTDLMQEFSFWPTAPPRKLGGIFELRSYTLRPGNLLEWETHWRKGLPARRKVMEGVGAWFTQVGELNRVHYLWQFGDLRERQVAREKSWGEKGWGDTVHKTVPLIQRMESRILVPLPWSPIG